MNKITITDRFIFSYINSFTRNKKPVFASNEHISKQINKSESVVSHSISRLLKLGYLENRGNKYARQLFTKEDLISANCDVLNADFNQSNAENSISLAEINQLIAENSNNETLKLAVANAENSYILIKILLSYTNKEIDKEKPPKDNNTINIKFEEFWKEYIPYDMVKGSKLSAEKSYNKALKETTHETIISKCREYCKYCQEKTCRTKHAATWINQKGWKDDYSFDNSKTSSSVVNIGNKDDKLRDRVNATGRLIEDLLGEARY